MAYNSNCASALFLIALLFAASNPLANGQILQGLSLNGTLCCTPTGNCTPGALGINGTRVSLNCTILGTTVTVGQGITNANGTFNITVPRILGLVLGSEVAPCVAVVRLPLNSTVCPILATTNGILASAIQSTGTLLTALFGLVQTFGINGFFRVGA